ncbi:MAG: M23 family metallopeptidase [Nitrospinae bacterium]|nr:M23 family metallopeptidase [Nitrospinota bacterium]
MRGKYYTIMVFPERIDEPRRFIVSRFLVQTLTILSCFFLICFITAPIFFTHRYIEMSKKVVNIDKLRNETMMQKTKIERFAKMLDDFEAQMVRLERFDKKLRIITSLEESEDPSNKKWGVGGIDKDRYTRFNSTIRDDYSDSVVIDDLHEDLKYLKLQAGLQEISFQELDEFLKDQRSLLSASPSIWPTKGWLTSRFGYRNSPFTGISEMHEGIDIATRVNSPVYSTGDGVVISTGMDYYGFGNVLDIDHGYGIVTRYGHNARNLVKEGDKVKKGQLIALVGNTGRSTGSHLHYEVIINGVPVDPLKYIMESNYY